MVTAPSCLRRHRANLSGRSCGYRGTIPATLGLLPASRGYPAALIAAYGIATETVPGGIAIADDAVMGVHITRLLPDGSWRDRGDDAKITIGHCLGSPIALASSNDLLGLTIAEGIEDALMRSRSVV
jgi:hypothetical protein